MYEQGWRKGAKSVCSQYFYISTGRKVNLLIIVRGSVSFVEYLLDDESGIVLRKKSVSCFAKANYGELANPCLS